MGGWSTLGCAKGGGEGGEPSGAALMIRFARSRTAELNRDPPAKRTNSGAICSIDGLERRQTSPKRSSVSVGLPAREISVADSATKQ